MDCPNCEFWNKGAGTRKVCPKCTKYKTFQVKYSHRESVRAEYLPEALIENIEDPRYRTLKEIIKQLPPLYSVPLMMKYDLDMSYKEIADYHGKPISPMQRRISHAIKILKKSLLDG